MSITYRQNRLLVAEDWKKIYQSFRNADFQSYDFENLRRTMIDYIRTNYPEDFNDYIESSEYLALIDLIAFLGQSIAFRVDLNARDNFLELSERREAVLRLARMISYNAKRNIAANGLLKFTTVITTENVIDSNGRNMSGQVITWNDPSNSNWYDQFIKVVNASFPRTQQFGNPVNKATVYGIPTQQYRMNSEIDGIPSFSFTKNVAGRLMNFEIVSTEITSDNTIREEAPKINNILSCLYRDDGKGPGAADTGFFLKFTQGTLNQGTFAVTQPSNNESIDIEASNINNSDVWLYRLDNSGLESEYWTQVSSLEGNNIIYNSLDKGIRNIYSVITRARDSVTLQFSDGTFGNLPLGTFRAYYRVSNGLDYSISPQDLRSVTISIPYTSSVGQSETLTVSLSLTSTVSNAAISETNDSIKANAPATYYTQNRMITGEDYNISPLSSSTQVLKIKALNRVSSGISRYFDLTDPTGKYSSTNLFADDGIVYTEEFNPRLKFSYLSRTDIEGVIYNDVLEILRSKNLRNFYYSKFINTITLSLKVNWENVTLDTNYSTGYITDENQKPYKVGSFTENDLKYIVSGALIKFTAPIVDGVQTYFDTLNFNAIKTGPIETKGATTVLWVEVVSVENDGTAAGTGLLPSGDGPIALNQIIPTGAIISQVIPRWRTSLESSVITAMIDLIFSNRPFGLRYESSTQTWQIIYEANLDSKSSFSLGKQGDISSTQKDSSWLLLFTTDNEFYTITSREQRYIFESDEQIQFYYDKNNNIYDTTTNKVVRDVINILSINTQPGLTVPFNFDQKWEIISEYTGMDGYVDSKKLIVTFADLNNNGVVDNPELFLNLVVSDDIPLQKKYIIQERYSISVGQEDYRYVDNSNNIVIIKNTQDDVYLDPLGLGRGLTQYDNGQYFYFVDTGVVKKLDLKSSSKLQVSLDYKVFLGRDHLKFQYTHSADYESRIDPGTSNIIDIYVLTKNYDTQFRRWISGAITTKPLPLGSDEIYDLVSPKLNLIKSISDEVVYHPVNYKVLFGPTASIDLQASFKVVKNSDQVISDNDIKSRVIIAINEFFDLENWDFGDTFYFTELSAYVMTKLAPDIANFVIVPRLEGLNFGSLFEIKSSGDQLLISGATVDDIDIVLGLTPSIIKSLEGTAVSTITVSTQNITSSTYGASNG